MIKRTSNDPSVVPKTHFRGLTATCDYLRLPQTPPAHTRAQDSNKIKGNAKIPFLPPGSSVSTTVGQEGRQEGAASGPCLVLEKQSGTKGGGHCWYY